MAIPMFFHDGALEKASEIVLAEETTRHVLQVLRMQVGHKISLTDGKGTSATTSILKTEKKKCFVKIDEVQFHAPRKIQLYLCVAFTKNSSRNEWLLEKATELGASSIIPIISERTEREKFRYDRWRNILIAALIQSQQYYLPKILEATSLKEILQKFKSVEQKLIGHCIEVEEKIPLSIAMKPNMNTLVFIGPEGDFTNEEVSLCIENGCVSVDMGSQRLRTETAAMAACAYFNLINYEN